MNRNNIDLESWSKGSQLYKSYIWIQITTTICCVLCAESGIDLHEADSTRKKHASFGWQGLQESGYLPKGDDKFVPFRDLRCWLSFGPHCPPGYSLGTVVNGNSYSNLGVAVDKNNIKF